MNPFDREFVVHPFLPLADFFPQFTFSSAKIGAVIADKMAKAGATGVEAGKSEDEGVNIESICDLAMHGPCCSASKQTDVPFWT